MGINQLIATLRRRTAREEGFSLIEVTMAIGVLFIALLALARTATVAFSDVSLSRQRQVGNQLANQLIEEIRALPYDTLKSGLSSSDLTGDTNIVNCGGNVYRYVSCATGEKIIHTAGLPTTSPLVPHTGNFGPPQFTNTYSWKTYVTEATDVPSKGAYRVNVIVDWNPTTRGGTRTEVNAQTLVFSPEGCTDTATHPFGAPCQAYFYSTGNVGGGAYTVTGTFEGGISVDSMSAYMLSESSDIQLEQIGRVEGDVVLPHITKVVGGTETIVTNGVSSAADTDPATTTGTYLSQSVGPQAAGSLSESDAEYATTISLAGADSGSTISTTAAGGANACNLQIDGKACGFASGTQSGPLTHTLNVLGPGSATVLSVAGSGTPSTLYSRRYQPVASTNGLVRETVSWTLPTISIGGIPPLVPQPNNWGGYWVRLSGFSASASAESGVSTVAPTVTISGGTISYWNGNGYTSQAVTAAGGTIPIAAVNEGTNGSIKRTVDITGEVTWEPSTTSQVTSTPATTRTEGKATIGAPLVVEMTYVVSNNQPGQPNDRRATLGITFSPGQALLTTQYKP